MYSVGDSYARNRFYYLKRLCQVLVAVAASVLASEPAFFSAHGFSSSMAIFELILSCKSSDRYSDIRTHDSVMMQDTEELSSQVSKIILFGDTNWISSSST